MMNEAFRLIETKVTQKGIEERRKGTKEKTEETGSCEVLFTLPLELLFPLRRVFISLC
jgi:hypothetical protein